MTTVVATHAVGDMDTWLRGGDERRSFFERFCTSYRIFKHPDKDHASIVFEGVDLEKMKATLGSPEAVAARTKHTVIEPVEIYIEVERGA